MSISAKAQQVGDTLLIQGGRVVFIDKPHSSYHDKVFKYLLDGVDISTYKSTNYFNGQWISVHNYKGSNYAYFPSEPYVNVFLGISDSTLLINDFNEGFLTFTIKHIDRDKTNMHFKFRDLNGKKHFVILKKVSNDFIKARSSLFTNREIQFVKRDSYAEWPIVVNKCNSNNKCADFFSF